MLKTLDLAHIGDVHYPSAMKERLADIKDSGFPPTIAELARLKPLTCVARKFISATEKHADAILFTGDLTQFGDPAGYRECLTFLNELINLKRWPLEHLHAVPGNHDVDRPKVDPSGANLNAKFAEFATAWEDLGFPILAVDAVRQSSITLPKAPTSSVTLLSLNSSLGCGEKRYPKQIQDGLSKLLDKYASTVPKKDAFDLIGEELDTPAFDQNQLEEICQVIGGMVEHHSVPVVIAHHNILPQAIPRVAIYTELINAGVVRSRLSHLQRPVIYCHGHIHDHPVEVISEPEFDGSKLICIAAPTFSNGFNIISIEFGSLGTPLGCVVNSYRLSGRDGEVRCTTFRVPFYSPSYANVRHHGSRILPNILANLPEVEIRLPDLRDKLSLKPNQRRALADALLEGEWLGVVELSDKQEELEHWIVRKVIR